MSSRALSRLARNNSVPCEACKLRHGQHPEISRTPTARHPRLYERMGRRFVEALAAAGTSLKRAKGQTQKGLAPSAAFCLRPFAVQSRSAVEDVQTALEAMRAKADGSMSSPATVNTYVAAVKALLGFAHKVGFTRFNAAPLIELRKAPRKTVHRLLSQSKRDRSCCRVGICRSCSCCRAGVGTC